jgi:4-amino-4-deoxy-L-arabinose transferase-like glycosyltransferase
MSEGRPSDTAFHVAAARASLTSRQHALLLGAALLALALRCLHLWGQARNNPLYEILMMDPLVHHEWAQRIAAGEGMGEEPYFRAPLYYYALGGLYALTGFGHTAARLFGCALGALTCYLVGRLGAELEDFRTGLLAAVLAGFYWPLIYFDNELVSVCLENTLNAGALLSLIVAGRRRSPRLFLLGGLLWGASAVTRPSVLVLAPAFALWTWIAATPPGRVRSALFSAALVGAGAALVIAPVTARNVIVGGEHVAIATNGGVNFYIGNNPRSNGFSAVVPGAAGTIRGVYEDSHHLAEADVGHRLTRSESSRYWLERSIDWIRSEPDAFAAHLLRKLRYLLAPVEVPNNQPILFFTRYSEVSAVYWLGFPILFCLAAAGLVLAASDWRRWFLPFAFVALHAATVVMFFAAARFRAPLAPVLCVAAATVVWRAPGLLAARSWKRLAAARRAAPPCSPSRALSRSRSTWGRCEMQTRVTGTTCWA